MWIPSSPSIQVTTNPRDARNSIAPTLPNVFSTTWIKPTNPDNGDRFGYSVAVRDRWMAVAAPNEDSNVTGVSTSQSADNSSADRGCVFIYYLNPASNAWEFNCIMKQISPFTSEWGTSLAFNEDGSKLAIGHAGHTSSANQYVYIYHRTGTAWAYHSRITSSNWDSVDFFGTSIGFYGDVLAVSAQTEQGTGSGINPAANNSGTNIGAVYIFRWNGSAYIQEAYIKPRVDRVVNSLKFGNAIALYNNTLIVGSVGSGTATDQQVEVFDYNGSVWQYTTYLISSNIDTSDQFGQYTIGLYDDYALVGAAFEDGTGTGINPASNNSGNANGACYLFKRTAGVWSQTAYIKPSHTDTSDAFGRFVSIWGNKILVSCHLEDGSGTGLNPTNNNSLSAAGSCYLFTYDSSGIPTQTHYIKTPMTLGVVTTFPDNGDTSCHGATTVALGDNIVVCGCALEDSNNTITGIQYGTPNALGANTGAVFIYNI